VRVLYLVSTHGWPARITPYSFIDEEIHALVARGVEPYLLSEDVAVEDERDGVRVLPVPAGTWPERLQTLPFLRASWAHLPPGSMGTARRTFHAVRLERYATEAVRRHGIDVMHTHFAAYGMAGMLARVHTRTPLIATFRGMDLLLDPSIDYGVRQERFYDRTIRTLLRNADMTTYVSDFMRQAGIRLGADPETARTIRKGVDLERFQVAEDRLALRRALDVPGPMILTVAGLIPRKGVDTVIEALARLPSDDATLVVCGDGYYRDQLVALSQELGVGDRVRFCGRVSRDEIAGYFAACDVFVLASRLEAAGNVVLEAMASGRPVVTTDSGGPTEFVREGRTGYVVRPGDAVALADRLQRLLSDDGLREGMGRASRQVMEEAYPYGNMIDGFLEVYRQVLDAGPRGRPVRRTAP
jgi:D-inositol-3-phosphate glycosyltransferase